jgi:hopanoid biosynthesis associated RND transporter like protein HpnN
MNSELGALIEQAGDWRQDFDRFETDFPMLIDTVMVVVGGRSFQAVEDTSQRIEHALERDTAVFKAVYSPANDPFFRDHALLYLDIDQLERTVDRLAEAQPILTAVAEDPSLRGVLGVVQEGVENDPVAGFDRILDLLIESAAGVVRGEGGTIHWADEFFDSDGKAMYRVIFAKGQSEFGAAQPNSTVMARVHEIVKHARVDAGVAVLVGGEIALAHEEIKAAQEGVALAGTVSILLLAIVLFFGIRSGRIILATFLLVGIGVVWTGAWAMIAVGEFNTLSLVFLAMFFGLGVDFSIHYCLRYEEALAAGDDNVTALMRAAGSVGGAIVLCSTTTAIGFLGFTFTRYSGLADLGIISAGGIVIAALLTFCLLPAFFSVFGALGRLRAVDVPSADRWIAGLVRGRMVMLPLLGLLSLAALYVDRGAYFDFSVLALRDPTSESMRTLRLLNDEGIVTDYSLAVLGTSPDGDATLQRVAQLPVVKEVRNPVGYLPAAQQRKLEVLGDAGIMLDSALNPARQLERPNDEARESSLRRLISSIQAHPRNDDVYGPRLHRLETLLNQISDRGSGAVRSYELGVISDLETELDWLRRAIAVRAVTFEDLPQALRVRLESPTGAYLSQVLPEQDISRVENLKAFVEQVRAVEPSATGRPVIEWAVGNIVVDSFVQALALAVVGIALVLIAALRSLVDTLLVLTPLVLAAVFTVATAVLLDMPFNMANVLVLPLIFGLGVDNGIHVVERFRREGDVGHLMHSSTPRAVLLSTLTTVGAFAALMLSPHRGTASIGSLLTIAVLFLLLFTVLVLPMLLTVVRGREPTVRRADA